MDSIFMVGLGLTIIIVIVTQIIQILSKTSSKLQPPGKKGWPLIGETTTFVSCPMNFVLDRMRDHSPDVFQTSLAGETMAIFCGPTSNKFIFSNELKLVRSWLPRSISKALAQQNADPNSLSYKLADQVSHKFLKLDCIQQYAGTMDSMVKQHLDKFWLPFDQVKVHPLAKEFTFELSCRIFVEFSNPSPELIKQLRDPFFEFIEGIFSTPLNIPGMPYYKALKKSALVQEKLFGIMEQRKIQLSDVQQQQQDQVVYDRDLLGQFLMATDEHGTSVRKEDVARVIVGFIFASFYTTSTTIAFVVYFLSKHPDIYEKVLQEQMEIKKAKEAGDLLTWADVQKMKYSWNVICETMRLRPPATGGYKEAIADFTYSGFNIPKGWKVHWSAYSTNMNPKYFPDPENFDPSRFEGSGPPPFTFVPFGGGPRMCTGKEYARMETLVFLHNLVTKFRFKMVNPNEKIFYNPDPVPAEGLQVYLQPH
uniref:beta-amyrin 28-monooxygenase n=2 Tax=Chenopodium quinoa TaxID=63459 RepID=A0A1B2AS11_CHEQI|nr:Cytochrome P450 [Chenopodium quinoa]